MTDVNVSDVAAVRTGREGESYVDWSAVLAGAVLATAISFVLFTFGGAIGLSLSSPYEGEGLSVGLFTLGAGLWFLWVTVSSFLAGGYLAGRLRRRAYDATEHEVDVRDSAHGLLVWATGALAGAVLAAMSFGGAPAARAGAEVSATVAAVSETVTEAVDAAATANADETVGDAVGAELTAAEEARADGARRLGVIAAFIAAASLLVSAAAAFFAAGVGGKHRDQNTVVSFFVRRRW